MDCTCTFEDNFTNSFCIGCIEWFLTTFGGIFDSDREAADIYVEENSLNDLLGNVGLENFEGLDESKESELSDAANETPIIRFVNLVMQQAIRAKASDIHFEPFEHEFRIRYRVDGALYEMSPPPKSLALPVISRIKVIADLNIAEHRIPQDGRIKMTIEGGL